MRIKQQIRIKPTAQSLGEGQFHVELTPVISLSSSLNNKLGQFVDVGEVGRVSIVFSVDVEARDWGIKGISIFIPPAKVGLGFVLIENDNEREVDIQFEPSKVPLQLTTGGQVTLTKLELVLNDDFTINYQKSLFEGTSLIGVEG
jgi:hypothetical protein